MSPLLSVPSPYEILLFTTARTHHLFRSCTQITCSWCFLRWWDDFHKLTLLTYHCMTNVLGFSHLDWEQYFFLIVHSILDFLVGYSLHLRITQSILRIIHLKGFYLFFKDWHQMSTSIEQNLKIYNIFICVIKIWERSCEKGFHAYECFYGLLNSGLHFFSSVALFI